MAGASGHKFGQALGKLLEEIFLPELNGFCQKHGLYLDRHGKRPGVRTGKKATWKDKYENSHDLDFVIEKGGSIESLGRPLAFIEVAWRGYTKHSKNKAQEIQGAILPLAEKYDLDKPFLGAILVGAFTPASRAQLKSMNFDVVYIDYDKMVAACRTVGFEIAYEEKTPADWFDGQVKVLEAGGEILRKKLGHAILESHRDELDDFLARIEQKLRRRVKKITVIPLFGSISDFRSLVDAARFVRTFDGGEGKGAFRKFEIIVTYSNGDKLDGSFETQHHALNFLKYVREG